MEREELNTIWRIRQKYIKLNLALIRLETQVHMTFQATTKPHPTNFTNSIKIEEKVQQDPSLLPSEAIFNIPPEILFRYSMFKTLSKPLPHYPITPLPRTEEFPPIYEWASLELCQSISTFVPLRVNLGADKGVPLTGYILSILATHSEGLKKEKKVKNKKGRGENIHLRPSPSSLKPHPLLNCEQHIHQSIRSPA